MIKQKIIEAPNYIIELEDYIKFITLLKETGKFVPKLNILKSEKIQKMVRAAGNLAFNKYINLIKEAVNQRDLGISSLDVPTNDNMSTNENAFWGALSLLSISLNLFLPIQDSLNNTPFTVYNASKENEKILSSEALLFYSPEAKLGFHNDGGISATEVFLPKYLMIYNLFIGYKNPGNFYFVPSSLWKDKKYFSEIIGIDREFNISITPIIYRNQDATVLTNKTRKLTLPIFKKLENQELYVFLNGDIISSTEGNELNNAIMDNMKQSISNNEVRYSVLQKMRRGIFVDNTLGFHARDIFSEPLEGINITRSFIRSIDSQGITMKQNVQ